MARNLLALASLLLVGLLLACVIMSAALRAGMITPVIGRVTLGGYMLDTTIENRVCSACCSNPADHRCTCCA
jgi:hypothetical protein